MLVSIGVTPPNPSIANGYTEQFTATGVYSDNSTQNLTTSVTWSSSNTGAATISNAANSNGLASSVAVGSTTITATDSSTTIQGTTSLAVTPAVLVSIGVTPANPSIAKGYSQQFTATGVYSDNSTQNLTTSVTWSSSNTGTATISNAVGSSGLASSLAVGSTNITATDPSTAVSGSTGLTVTSAVLVSIGVTPPNPSIANGYTEQFTATGVYSDNSTQNLTSAVTWSSSATGYRHHFQRVSAMASRPRPLWVDDHHRHVSRTSISGTTGLTVTPAVLVSIGVTPATPSIANGYTQQFAATGAYSETGPSDSDRLRHLELVRYRCRHHFASGGLASSVAVGSTNITATYPGTSISGSTSFTVTPAVLVSIGVSPPSPSFASGYAYTEQFTATGIYSDNSTQDLTASVTWGSSNTASPPSPTRSGLTSGLVSAEAVGTTTDQRHGPNDQHQQQHCYLTITRPYSSPSASPHRTPASRWVIRSSSLPRGRTAMAAPRT